MKKLLFPTKKDINDNLIEKFLQNQLEEVKNYTNSKTLATKVVSQ